MFTDVSGAPTEFGKNETVINFVCRDIMAEIKRTMYAPLKNEPWRR